MSDPVIISIIASVTIIAYAALSRNKTTVLIKKESTLI